MVNAPNWLVLDLRIGDGPWCSENGLMITGERRELDLRRGMLTRTAVLTDPLGRQIHLTQRRLVSMARPHLAALETTLVAQGWTGPVSIRSGIDAGVVNDNVAEYRREEDGSFTKLEPSFSNLVLYRATAERAYERFAKGDSFVAEGYAHEYSYTRDGQQVEGEEFVPKKIGHDTARTRYEVDRTPRRTTERESVTREQNRAFDPPPARPAADAPVLGH